MSRDELLAYLESLTDPRFAEAATILKRAAQAPDLKVSVSRRLVPTRELREIYAARLDSCRSHGTHVPGIAAFVEILASTPCAAWRMLTVSGAGMAGAVFSNESDDVCACVAGNELTALGE